MQRMVYSALHVFQESILDRRIEKKVETKVVSLLGTANHEAANAEKPFVHQLVEISYAESSLEAPSISLYTWRLITFPSRRNLFNASRGTLSRSLHSQCPIFPCWNSMRKLRMLMSTSCMTKVWPAPTNKNKLIHYRPWLRCPQSLLTQHLRKRKGNWRRRGLLPRQITQSRSNQRAGNADPLRTIPMTTESIDTIRGQEKWKRSRRWARISLRHSNTKNTVCWSNPRNKMSIFRER